MGEFRKSPAPFPEHFWGESVNARLHFHNILGSTLRKHGTIFRIFFEQTRKSPAPLSGYFLVESGKARLHFKDSFRTQLKRPGSIFRIFWGGIRKSPGPFPEHFCKRLSKPGSMCRLFSGRKSVPVLSTVCPNFGSAGSPRTSCPWSSSPSVAGAAVPAERFK